MDAEIRELLQEVKQDFSREVANQIGQLKATLDIHQADLYAHQPARQEGKTILAGIDQRFQAQNERISAVEKWRWIITGGMTVMVTGGAVVIPYILTHLK